MSGRTFVDTNVLIYAHDSEAGAKREIAREIIGDLWDERSGLLSVQVLQEFYVNATRKIAVPLSTASARAVVAAYKTWCIPPAIEDVADAFRAEDEARIGFWDALVIASATRSGAARILSEDLNAGQSIRGIKIENPFANAG
ncbi:MAG TPA: PIN domain-containing protein [Candidatus Acidoferrum sp.]|nr:PIN domain-containing protein [Candidatus Acidoferrum sp.]